ncbi:MAG: hypothetical protein IPK59_09650 [Rhodospirillaceae bacterium]|nr:hypothetical protein [Rhodospirillaceae bacterium]
MGDISPGATIYRSLAAQITPLMLRMLTIFEIFDQVVKAQGGTDLSPWSGRENPWADINDLVTLLRIWAFQGIRREKETKF